MSGGFGAELGYDVRHAMAPWVAEDENLDLAAGVVGQLRQHMFAIHAVFSSISFVGSRASVLL